MISSLDQMVNKVLALNKKHSVAVAWAQDTNTIGALNKAVTMGFINAILIGKPAEIIKICNASGIDYKIYHFGTG
jgi:phosphate butyryltransferase